MSNIMVGQISVVVLIIVIIAGLRYEVRILRVMMVGNKLVAEQKSNGKEE